MSKRNDLMTLEIQEVLIEKSFCVLIQKCRDVDKNIFLCFINTVQHDKKIQILNLMRSKSVLEIICTSKYYWRWDQYRKLSDKVIFYLLCYTIYIQRDVFNTNLKSQRKSKNKWRLYQKYLICWYNYCYRRWYIWTFKTGNSTFVKIRKIWFKH